MENTIWNHWNAADWVIVLLLAYLVLNFFFMVRKENRRLKRENSMRTTGRDKSDRAA